MDERRAQLIERGRRLFNVKAYDEVSIDDIAAAAGVSKGLLYHYFPGKKPFYVATVAAAAEEMLARTSTDAQLPPDEQLRLGLVAYLDYVEANARGYAALLRGGVGMDPEVAAVVDKTREVLMKRVSRGMGIAEPAGATRLALRAWVGFVEAAVLEWVERRAVNRDELVNLLFNALVASMSAVSELKENP